MIVCKIECPSCGTGHDVPYDSLSDAKSLECTICGHNFPLSSENKDSQVKAKKKSKNQTNLKFGSPATKRKTARKSNVQKKSSDSISTKYIVNVCIIGLVLVLVSIGGYKFFSSKKKSSIEVAKNEELKEVIQELKTTNMVKAEMADLKRQLLDAQKEKSVAKPTAKAAKLVSVAAGETVILENYGNRANSILEPQTIEEAPVFGGGGQQTEEVVEEAPQPEMVTVNDKTMVSAKTILIPSEQNEMEELNKIPSYELTDEEKNTLTELKNKYLWFKANRFKLTREQMEYEWDRRWSAIQDSNKVTKSRSDAMLPRPLQILLEGAETQKERAYLMRIFQKPVSFEEKEIVRKARNQAIWERRKADGPMTYPEDSSKKRNKKYIDEYGYEYYLDDKGQRVYL